MHREKVEREYLERKRGERIFRERKWTEYLDKESGERV